MESQFPDNWPRKGSEPKTTLRGRLGRIGSPGRSRSGVNGVDGAGGLGRRALRETRPRKKVRDESSLWDGLRDGHQSRHRSRPPEPPPDYCRRDGYQDSVKGAESL
jgi:hypothetical protein